jgi:hypothetical protein
MILSIIDLLNKNKKNLKHIYKYIYNIKILKINFY